MAAETRDKMAGRGVLLDVARHLGKEYLADGEAITNDDLDACANAQGVQIRRGDFVIVRTGQMEQRLKAGEWGGYAGGEAPGLAFETCEWIQQKEIAAICTDTWAVNTNPLRNPAVMIFSTSLRVLPRTSTRPRN